MSSPKDAAIEFARALSGGDFSVARALAVPELKPELERRAGLCGDCESRRRRKDQLRFEAELVAAQPQEAYVRVKTFFGKPGQDESRYGLLVVRERSGDYRLRAILPYEAPTPVLTPPPLPTPDQLPPGARPLLSPMPLSSSLADSAASAEPSGAAAASALAAPSGSPRLLQPPHGPAH